MKNPNDPMQRLATAFRVEIDPQVQERHLAEVNAALIQPPASPSLGRNARRRRLAGALAAATLVLAPTAMAVAAEGSLPGEALYPMKQATERIRGLIDGDLVATHRVEELEALVEGEAPDELVFEASDRATRAVAELDDSGDLDRRLERAQEQVRERARTRDEGETGPEGTDEGAGEPGGNDHAPPNGTGPTTAPRTGSDPPEPTGPRPDETETEQPASPDAESEQDRSRDGTGDGSGSGDGGETSDEPGGTLPGNGNGGLGGPGGPDRP